MRPKCTSVLSWRSTGVSSLFTDLPKSRLPLGLWPAGNTEDAPVLLRSVQGRESRIKLIWILLLAERATTRNPRLTHGVGQSGFLGACPRIRLCGEKRANQEPICMPIPYSLTYTLALWGETQYSDRLLARSANEGQTRENAGPRLRFLKLRFWHPRDEPSQPEA